MIKIMIKINILKMQLYKGNIKNMSFLFIIMNDFIIVLNIYKTYKTYKYLNIYNIHNINI